MNTPAVRHHDFLIIGQGLAGTLLSHFLIKENKTVMVIGHPLPGASSVVAAGVINPVTGRRLAKSWRYEELFDFARQTYLELEGLLGASLWQERDIYRALHSNFEENEWERRGAFPEYEAYLSDVGHANPFPGKIRSPHAWGKLQHCAQVDVPSLVQGWRRELQRRSSYLESCFDHSRLEAGGDSVRYGPISAGTAVFCEGASAAGNPFFNHLPIVPTKGELLIVRIPGAGFSDLVKHKLFIIPIRRFPLGGTGPADDLYWVGSSSRWEFKDPYPSAEQRRRLVDELREVLETPFEVVDHLAGVRPTVEDIRPILGFHPMHRRLAVFNGLGTKGTSLGPFFARQMAMVLLGRQAPDAEVDIRRFS